MTLFAENFVKYVRLVVKLVINKKRRDYWNFLPLTNVLTIDQKVFGDVDGLASLADNLQ